MSIRHLKTDAYVRACVREKKIARLVGVIIDCPDCGHGIIEATANFCPGCGTSLTHLQHVCDGCGERSLYLAGPFCEVCGHRHAGMPEHPVNHARMTLRRSAA